MAPWIATGLRPRDDRVLKNGSVHNLSLGGGNGSERRGNPSCPGGGGRVCLYAYWLTVDRHGLRPRDDKVWGNGSVRFGYITILVIARRERK